jgi:DNA-binding NarL/FixJ family response regulator
VPFGDAIALAQALPDEQGDRSMPMTGWRGRELQVLQLVAAGKTNHGIARELVLSEHMVARRVANILNKFRLGSRAAAMAFAMCSGLI